MILKEISRRRSIRSFKKNLLPDDYVLQLIKAAQFAPNSHHNRSWEFILVKNQITKIKLYDILGQSYLKEAPVLIIPLIDTTKSLRPVQDISVASENIFLQATKLGLGSVWKNISEENSEKVRKLLNIPNNFMLINIIPVGYIKTKRRPHSEKDFDIKKIHQESW